ncbi:hypothetical protein ACROYT_G031622, partial [Oculina patagonica]
KNLGKTKPCEVHRLQKYSIFSKYSCLKELKFIQQLSQETLNVISWLVRVRVDDYVPLPTFLALQGTIWRRHVVCVEHTLVEDLKRRLLKMFCGHCHGMRWCRERISGDVFFRVQCFLARLWTIERTNC